MRNFIFFLHALSVRFPTTQQSCLGAITLPKWHDDNCFNYTFYNLPSSLPPPLPSTNYRLVPTTYYTCNLPSSTSTTTIYHYHPPLSSTTTIFHIITHLANLVLADICMGVSTSSGNITWLLSSLYFSNLFKQQENESPMRILSVNV